MERIENNEKDSLGLSSKIKGRLGGSAECWWSCYITTSDAAKYTASSQRVSEELRKNINLQ